MQDDIEASGMRGAEGWQCGGILRTYIFGHHLSPLPTQEKEGYSTTSYEMLGGDVINYERNFSYHLRKLVIVSRSRVSGQLL